MENQWKRRKYWPKVAVFGLLATAVALAGLAAQAAAQQPDGAISAQVQSGSIGPARQVTPLTSSQTFVLSKEQLAERERILAEKSKHRAPPLGPRAALTNSAVLGGPQTSATQIQAPNDFTIFKKSQVTSTCATCAQSQINEATSANSGRVVVETSNWNIAYTLHGNANPVPWNNIDPASFGPGFCCDQQVTYDADHDVFLLLQLDYSGEGNVNNGLALSVARGTSPTSWCTYKFAGAIGGGATDTPDFPKIAVANNNVFLTWNDYPPNLGFARSGLARMPLDSIAACAGFNYTFITRTTEFTFALAQSPSVHDQFYWVSNWMLDGTVNGANLRIFWWPNNSNTYFFLTRAINPYSFGNVACGSPNWCSRLDPRYESVLITPAEYRAQANAAFGGDQILEVAATAGPSGFSSGKNYVVYNYFKLNSLAYIGNDQTYSTTTHFAYPGCAVNNLGYVGCSMAQGVNVPGGLLVLQDNLSPTQPWAFSFQSTGTNGATGFGDYIVSSAWQPSGGPFQTVLWGVNASNVVTPFYFVWGRGHDLNGYVRWKGR